MATDRRYCCETHELIDRFLRWSTRGQRGEVFCLGFTTTQAYLLVELLFGGDLTMADLGERLGLARSTMTRVVAALERGGFVARRPGRDDRRAVFVTLTDEGKRSAESLAECFRAFWTHVFERIPPGRQDEVGRAVRVLLQAIEEAWPQCCPGGAGRAERAERDGAASHI